MSSKKAVAAQEAGDYAGAMALFADAGQYADSMARLRECCKQQGISIYYFSADAVNAGVDTGYAKQDTISGDDKHFGWRLGRFFLTGFTRVTADENQQPVFIKTLGDSVTLWFDLEQDIDALNGNAQRPAPSIPRWRKTALSSTIPTSAPIPIIGCQRCRRPQRNMGSRSKPSTSQRKRRHRMCPHPSPPMHCSVMENL